MMPNVSDIIAWIASNDGSIAAICAVLALVTSFVAIVLTKKTLDSQHRHNRLSVKPVPMFGIGDYENRIFLSLKNVGLGPLVVKDFWSMNGVTKSSKPLIELMPELSNGYAWSDFRGNIQDRVIPQNEQLMLLELCGDPDDNSFTESRDRVRKALGSLTVFIKYSDLYESDEKTYDEFLGWFHRH